ncbi:dihydroorotate dehydrogenase electron transfer subunit [Tepidibacillus infernus]|uniref:dihydroorotate dehydrogenase electron transfer subunit n=1 Tax=Tepidibacillus TaxID=1494427 RepID=UPI0008534FE8|nr:dihydroorotate dehydrogenase electron transfer subunit [Tepidibacillus sp. HK-1]GBF11946.1 dihydroorotate dehydrogenase B (NAD(+)), electron transfer subunit [Tepidibacillus sp. HK-1]
MKQSLMKVLENKEIAHQIYQIVIEPKTLQANTNFEDFLNEWYPQPGQFFHIRVNDSNHPFLRRPISVHDFDPNTLRISMIYRVNGEGTKRLTQKTRGEIVDVLGPLGNGFPVSKTDKQQFLLIGGGIGIPPLYYLAKQLKHTGHQITTLLGFQSKQDIFLLEQFSSFGEIRVATMDGSLGSKGTVLDLIKEEEHWDLFYSCGPTAMMKAIQQKWMDKPIEGYLSLEERMGCAIGACYGCVVKVDQAVDLRGYKKVCADGPVFSFREVKL